MIPKKVKPKKLTSKKVVSKKLIRLSIFQKLLAKISILWLTIFLVALFWAVIIFALWLFSSVESSSQTKKIVATPLKQAASKSLQYNVFGDHFSNDLSIDKGRTTFYYDSVTTAFTFLPRYNLSAYSYCSEPDCGIFKEDLFFPGIFTNPISDSGSSLAAASKNLLSSEESQNYCLASRCLKVNDTSLYYQNNKIAVPAALKGSEILSISIYPLSRDWLVGFVAKNKDGEFGRAYRFSGTKFTDLDVKDKIPLRSRVGFEGAYFGFGGDDNNFLVLYGGYDFLGYQVTSNGVTDLKYFFGLRTSSGGFAPVAFKREQDGETIWYICSRLNGRPRFLKLWQNNSDSIKGILSFTEQIFKGKNKVDSAWCSLGEKANEVEIIVNQNNQYSRQIFSDNGFAQDNKYVIFSNNIFKEVGLVKQARFSGLIACGEADCGAKAFKSSLNFLAGTTLENIAPVEFGKDIIFKEATNGLYWKMSASSKIGNINYSPWVDGLTEVSYAWKKQPAN